MPDDEKRNSLPGMISTPPGDNNAQGGVGARHKASQPPVGVGEYLDICSISDSDFTASIRKNDPRIKSLRDMKIGATWVRIAEEIGFEAFMGLWKILGQDESTRIRMPPYTKWARYQRNLLIKQLASDGYRSDQIKQRVKRELCEDVSLRHIARILEKSKVKQCTKKQP